MIARRGTCEGCGAETCAGQRGPIPKVCRDCRYARQLVASTAWKQRNHEEYLARARATRDPAKAREAGRRRRVRHAERIREYRRRLYVERQAPHNAARVADYRRRNPGKHAEIQNRRRARLLSQYVAPVSFSDIWERDDGQCQICHTAVLLSDASLDHVIPLDRGGTHEPANVQLAHRVCNSRKGARVGN